ncbi:uncharacterized protein METZ01_LOCUS389697 [marine metagenome]|uniref:Uncharacterized protein n=1 Tax=marine metagenome TaxID=408172 RepID=A0A382URE8_9ZZZZ
MDKFLKHLKLTPLRRATVWKPWKDSRNPGELPALTTFIFRHIKKPDDQNLFSSHYTKKENLSKFNWHQIFNQI